MVTGRANQQCVWFLYVSVGTCWDQDRSHLRSRWCCFLVLSVTWPRSTAILQLSNFLQMPYRCHTFLVASLTDPWFSLRFSRLHVPIVTRTIGIPVDSSWFGQGEFRSKKRGDSLSKRIVGFPEHITRNSAQVLVSQVSFELWTCFQIPFTTVCPCTTHMWGSFPWKSWLNSWAVKFLDSRWYWLHWRFCCFSRSGLWHHFATNICLLSDLVVWQWGNFAWQL